MTDFHGCFRPNRYWLMTQTEQDAAEGSLSQKIARFAPWKTSLLVVVFLLGCFDLENADIWWHLRSGELILERGEVPKTDWFTYTNPESEWLDLHWLFQIGAVTLWSIGGSTALVLAKSAIATLTIAIALSFGRRNWNEATSVACWLLPVLIYAGRYFVRPEVLTLFYLACTLLIFWKARKNHRWIWLLPIVQVLWVNSQGLFVLQFVLVGAFGLEQLARRASPAINRLCQISDEEKLLPMLPMIAAGLVTLLASLLNPYGIKGATFPITLFGRMSGPDRDFFLNYAGEFGSMGMFIEQYGIGAALSNLTVACIFALALLTIVSFLLLLKEGRVSIYRLLLFAAFAYLAWKMNRNGSLYAIVMGAILRLNLGQWWEMQFAKQSSRKNKRKKANADEQNIVEQLTQYKRPALLALGIVIAVLIISIPTDVYHFARPSIFQRRFGFGENQWYPHSGAKFLANPDMPDRIYANNLGVAAVSIWHLCPDKKVFADGRLETNSKQVLQAHSDILMLIARDEEFESLLRAEFREDFDHKNEEQLPMPAIFLDNRTLVSVPPVFGNLKKRGWRCVFFDDHQNGSVIFVTDELAEQLDLPAAETESLEQALQ